MNHFHHKNRSYHPIFEFMTSESAVDLLDTTLIDKDGAEVQCHALVILSMLGDSLGQFSGGGEYTIVYPDFSVKDLEDMLTYCYTGRCCALTDNLSSLLSIMKFKNNLAGSESQFLESDIVSASIEQVVENEANSDIMKEVEHADISHSSSTSNSSVSCESTEIISTNTRNESSIEQDIKDDKISSKKLSSDAMCCYCDKKFQHRQSMLRHVKEYHLKTSNHITCKTCDAVFVRKDKLEIHLRMEKCPSNDDSNDCNKCKKKFNSPDKLKSHALKNCRNKYFCVICLKFFKKKKEYVSHNH